jgi:hypothetical protein
MFFIDKARQTLEALVLIAGGFLTFNANANAQEAPVIPKKPTASKTRSLEDIQSHIRTLETSLLGILQANGKWTIEYSVNGEPYIAGFPPRKDSISAGIFPKNNTSQGYSDEGVDGELDRAPGTDSLRAHTTFKDLLAEAILAAHKQFEPKKGDDRKSDPPETLEQVQKEIVELEGKLGQCSKTISISYLSFSAGDFDYKLYVSDEEGINVKMMRKGSILSSTKLDYSFGIRLQYCAGKISINDELSKNFKWHSAYRDALRNSFAQYSKMIKLKDDIAAKESKLYELMNQAGKNKLTVGKEGSDDYWKISVGGKVPDYNDMGELEGFVDAPNMIVMNRKGKEPKKESKRAIGDDTLLDIEGDGILEIGRGFEKANQLETYETFNRVLGKAVTALTDYAVF